MSCAPACEVGRRLVELNDRLVETNAQLLDAKHELEIIASTDTLTGIPNRYAILKDLEREVERASREGGPLGLGMLDIDHFKLVNDTFGHAAGDAVLCAVVSRVLGVMRPYDGFGRFGGEEFLVLVPGSAEKELADVLERIRRAVGSAPVVVDGHETVVTVSGGGAVRGGESVDGLIARADAALYEAKEHGRDRIVMAPAGGAGA